MTVETKTILAKIESCRQELELLVTQLKSFEDERVQNVSRQLDLLINQYYRLT